MSHDEATQYVKIAGMETKTPKEASFAIRRTWGVEVSRSDRQIKVGRTDNGGQFTNKFDEHCTEGLNATREKSPPYRPIRTRGRRG